MIWNKKPVKKASPTAGKTTTRTDATSAASADPASIASALTLLGNLIEPLGELMREIGDPNAPLVREPAVDWARHVRTGKPMKEGEEASEEGSGRDWDGLRQFTAAAQNMEREAVTKTVKDLRDSLKDVIEKVSHTIAADRAGDKLMAGTMDKLGQAVESNSIEDLKKSATEAVGVINDAISDRKRRQEAQINELDSRLAAMSGELQSAKESATKDGLTGLFNRKAFDDELKRAIENGRRRDFRASLMMIDGDRFKNINDTYGHQAGDAVLVALAKCLRTTFTRRGDFSARYGGEEFAVLITGVSRETAYTMGRKIVKNVRALKIEYEGTEIPFTISAGVTMLKNGENAEIWLARADQALYEAKSSGRDRAILADPED